MVFKVASRCSYGLLANLVSRFGSIVVNGFPVGVVLIAMSISAWVE